MPSAAAPTPIPVVKTAATKSGAKPFIRVMVNVPPEGTQASCCAASSPPPGSPRALWAGGDRCGAATP
jgi:hypothetical protein